MSRFLIHDDNPNGHKLEEILAAIRNEVIHRATKIMDDKRPEAQTVLNNNITILGLLGQSIALAEDNVRVLDKSFGPHKGNKPRIGVP